MRTLIALGGAALISIGAGVLAAPPAAGPGATPSTPPAATPATAAKPWAEILGPAQGTVPPPRVALGRLIELPTHRQTNAKTSIDWEPNLKKGLEAARQENRPVFVTMRCLPCKSCSEFDKTVLEGGPDLDPLFRQFVTVRLTSAKDVDFRLLPMDKFQDTDVSWWSWFLSPDGRVYAVFGGRDETGDQARTSKAALVNTMKRVLAHHYDPRRPAWDVDGPAPALAGEPTTPLDLPGFGTWLARGEHKRMFQEHGCIHCHQVGEILRQGEVDARRFDKHRDLVMWPYAENVGIELDRDDGLRVKQVAPKSPADAAGIKPGDLIAEAGGRKLFGQADLRGVLHRLPVAGAATLDLHYVRDGKVSPASLALPAGWRKTEIYWRASVAEGVGGAPAFWPTDAGPLRDKLGIAKGSMAVKPFIGGKLAQGPAAKAGLKTTDVIIAVNGESPDYLNRQWLTWFRLKFEPGDDVTLTVKGADGATREVKYKAAE